MSDIRFPRPESRRVTAASEWWVLLITDGLAVEFPPELYRDQSHAESEGDRWAHLLSARTGDPIERPFEGRWEIGDRWIRLVHSFLPEGGPEIWVGTYWGRDGSPEPEAALFADEDASRAWALDPAPSRIAFETHENTWSAIVGYKVRGGEEEAEVHRAKVVADLTAQPGTPRELIVFGFEVSEGLIPQGPALFATQQACDRALREVIEEEVSGGEWMDFVSATAEGNYVEGELPTDWRMTWDQPRALDWLLGFDFISDGDDFEVRIFETALGGGWPLTTMNR